MFKFSFNNITAPIIATTGSKYKNNAVFDWPILGMANSCRNNAIAQLNEGINITKKLIFEIEKSIEKKKNKTQKKKIELKIFIKILIWTGEIDLLDIF